MAALRKLLCMALVVNIITFLFPSFSATLDTGGKGNTTRRKGMISYTETKNKEREMGVVIDIAFSFLDPPSSSL